ncbi:MAG TPA: 3'-5' exonuclease, partial [Methylomirabilota bacterium]|nr:3'-5' exonuclease [Methylomirabilota bacterium]
WPEVEASPVKKPERWEDPVDRTGPGSPDLRLAVRIADEIAGWLQRGERIAATGKKIRPGDILVLVRKRGPFVEAVNRELKDRGIAVAGADRLDVVGHIVAEDLIAAAQVALLPDDDLTLAAFARSPLVPPAAPGGPAGLSDEAVFAIAHGRGKTSLWSAVRAAAAAGEPDAVRLAARVETLLGRADTGDPYRFFAALVGPDGARAAFRARIGREADEVIDEFLALALAAEERGAATLASFLAVLSEAKEDVKREVDGGRNEIRVMTVHGAKGLEAPVVFLVDPGSPPSIAQHDPVVMPIGDAPGGPLVWVRPGLKPAPVELAVARHRQAQEEEYRRLLYVGLTRAADRLLVVGVKGARSKPDGRWHPIVRAALGPDARAVHDAAGDVERWIWTCPPERPPAAEASEDATARPDEPLPEFLHRPLAAPQPVRTLTPSAAAAQLSREEDDGEDARSPVRRDALDRVRGRDTPALRRGSLIHRLIEVLPEVTPGDRRGRAEAHLARVAPDLSEPDRSRIVASVLGVLEDPRFAAVFGPDGRAEVSLAGTIETAEGTPMSVFGQIDRLLATDREILIVDFKTGRTVSDRIPHAYAAQLALYRALMMRIRPGVPVRAAILWTEAPRLDELPAAEMDAILTRLVTNMGSPADPADA